MVQIEHVAVADVRSESVIEFRLWLVQHIGERVTLAGCAFEYVVDAADVTAGDECVSADAGDVEAGTVSFIDDLHVYESVF